VGRDPRRQGDRVDLNAGGAGRLLIGRAFLDGHGYRSYEFTTFGDTLALLPFAFDRQPRNRNLLCVNSAVSS